MKIVLDTHAHTLASGHAYNTIREMAKAAADKTFVNFLLIVIWVETPHLVS